MRDIDCRRICRRLLRYLLFYGYHGNYIRVQFNQLPEMEPGLSNDNLENARMEWHKASSGQQTVVITSSFCCGKVLLSLLHY